MTIKPFVRYRRIPFLCENVCNVYIVAENLSFPEALVHLRKDLRGAWYVVVPPTRKILYKRVRVDKSYLDSIKSVKLHIVRKVTRQRQRLIDSNVYLKRLPYFPPLSPRTKLLVQQAFSDKASNNTLIYAVDLLKPVPAFRNSVFFPILYNLRKDISFSNVLPENIILLIISGDQNLYIPFVINNDWNIPRVYALIKQVFLWARESTGKEKVIDVEKQTETVKEVSTKLEDELQEISKDTLEAIVHYSDVPEEVLRGNISANRISAEQVVRSALTNLVAPGTKLTQETLKNINESIIKPEPVKIYSNNALKPVVSKIIPPVSQASVQYRKIEEQHITQLFSKITSRVLEQNGLSLHNVSIQEIPPSNKEIAPTHKLRITLDIVDKTGKKHKININIPKIRDDGTLLVNGSRYIIPFQLIALPILFPKPGVARFSSYATTMTMQKLKTKTKIQVAGYDLPVGLYLCYIYGLKHIFDKCKIQYELSPSKIASKRFFKITPDLYLIIKNEELNELQSVILDNLFPYKDVTSIKGQPLSQEWFANLINSAYGNKYASTGIMNVSSIAVDERTAEILKNKNLPTNLFDILFYMLEGILTGRATPREDIRNTRARSYEMVLNVAYSELNKIINNYSRMQKYDSSKAKLHVDPDYILSKIITSGAIQTLEQGNPIEELHGLMKATFDSYKGIPRDAVPAAIRGINPSYFGTLDPVDTSEGASIGVNNSLTLSAMIGTKYGSIITKKLTDDSSFDMLAVTTSTIPFISKNEPTRALMAANQVRQAVLIKGSEPPVVQTGIESLVPSLLTTNTFLKKSPCSGKIQDVTSSEITLICDNGRKVDVDLKPTSAYSGSALHTYVSFSPVVRKGQKIKQGELLATSDFFKGGMLSMGRNALVAYMFWKGYNFEDGIVVSSKLRPYLTSKHVIKLFMFVDPQDRLVKLNIPEGKVKAGEVFVSVVSNKLSEIIDTGIVDSNQLLITGNRYTLAAPRDGRIVNYKIFCNVPISNLDSTISEKLDKYKVTGSGDYTYKGKKYEGIFIYIYYEVELPLSLGDKLTNRHAAKGVVTRIEPESEMPVLSDGRRVEVIINPISVINRSNIGQIYELYMGEISYQLAKKVTKLTRQKAIKLVTDVFLALPETPYSKTVVSYLSSCSQKQYEHFMTFIKKFGKFPIVVPPFKEPDYQSVLKAMKILAIPERYSVKLPSGNTVKAACGYQYIYKLEHIAWNKIHARSIGPYVSKTGQPTAGKSRAGGQRVGEFDIWSLASYDAENIIQEFFSAGSDDQELKRLMYRQIVDTGETSSQIIGKYRYTTQELFRSYMRSILIDPEI